MKWIMFVLVACVVAGCTQSAERKPSSGQPSPPAHTSAPPQSSTIVEDLTGYTSAKQGRKAAEKIRVISAEHNKSIEEVTGK